MFFYDLIPSKRISCLVFVNIFYFKGSKGSLLFTTFLSFFLAHAYAANFVHLDFFSAVSKTNKNDKRVIDFYQNAVAQY